MDYVTGWMLDAFNMSKTAARGLLSGLTTSDRLSARIAELEAELEAAKTNQGNAEVRSSSSGLGSLGMCRQHVCAACLKPSYTCVQLEGSSVDPEDYIGLFPESSSPCSARLLSSSKSNSGTHSHGPAVSEVSSFVSEKAKGKEYAPPDMLAVGGTLLPEITVEALRSVKLKRTGGPDLRSRINENGNLSAKVKPLAPSNQPVVTLAALQRVSLRKTSHVVKSHGDCVEDDLSRKENENSGDGTMVDIRKVLKRTTLQRSPGGTPMTSKRTRC
ncbi:uncharacterized protein LOC118479059 [Aplysia californica]|uniref:Uncharacterized protein LOC118479059 n=1 Tax=Aplysia californica TaxID=6500 RepID=A0ABM1W4F7_APLCA|nr:uncharacterized protein LOC118479059 [Aplysia californica]